eukprot:3667408-Rhodomonas_salina.1
MPATDRAYDATLSRYARYIARLVLTERGTTREARRGAAHRRRRGRASLESRRSGRDEGGSEEAARGYAGQLAPYVRATGTPVLT